ncbi:MAG TPA: hypothetical protein VEB64_18800 [Azospirillaceae bacterium]|nr:hypothetical protein [Azospirillaceae bacterium]
MLLPTTDRRARWLALVLLATVPLLYGALALDFGQDANWDLRNYHWYNAYAYLDGRHGFDLLPSQTPYFYNPLLDTPFFLLAQAVPAPVAGFTLGVVQGTNFILLFLLAHALLRLESALARVGLAAALALAGLLGGGALGLVGTTFYDNVISLGVTGSALVVTVGHRLMITGPTGEALTRAFLAGLPIGMSMGLKQPSVLFGAGLCLALLALGGPWQRRGLLALGFGFGATAATLAFSGPWMLHLWREHGNPLFPYLNDLFQSPDGAVSDYRQKTFIPTGPVERLLFPLSWVADPLKVGETPFRDLHIPLLYVLLPAAGLVVLCTRHRPLMPAVAEPAPARYLLLALATTYVLWLNAFSIYRYLIPLEMMAPLALALSAALLPLSRRGWMMLTVALLVTAQAAARPADWGRVPWGRHVVEADIPPLPKGAMVLMGGYWAISHVIPAFPPDIPFIRIQSNFQQPDTRTRFAEAARRRVTSHRGPLFMLSTIPDTPDVARAAARLGLELDRDSCQPIANNLGESLNLCPVYR